MSTRSGDVDYAGGSVRICVRRPVKDVPHHTFFRHFQRKKNEQKHNSGVKIFHKFMHKKSLSLYLQNVKKNGRLYLLDKSTSFPLQSTCLIIVKALEWGYLFAPFITRSRGGSVEARFDCAPEVRHRHMRALLSTHAPRSCNIFEIAVSPVRLEQ